MAEVIWTGPAKRDLEDIIEFIAVDNSDAASAVAKRIISHTRQLEKHPFSGSYVPEIGGTSIRQLIESPCRIFYRIVDERAYILQIRRFERILRVSSLQD